jgi:hypothetical protein
LWRVERLLEDPGGSGDAGKPSGRQRPDFDNCTALINPDEP